MRHHAGINDHLLGHDRAAALTAILPATAAQQTERDTARAEELRRQITRAENAINGLIAQMEHLRDDTSPAQARRDRITAQFGQRYDQQHAAQAELDALTASEQPPRLGPARRTPVPPRPPRQRARSPRHPLYAAFDMGAALLE